MPTKLPEGFEVSERVKEWAYKKYGYYDLPQQFVPDFRKHHAAKGSKYDDWDKALMNWIDWSSPSGKYYSAKLWEIVIEKCKRKMYEEKPKIEVPIKRPPPPRDKEYGMNQLEKAKQLLKG